MSGEEFIGYIEAHSRTPRALFSAEMIRRLYALAGRDVPPGVVGWIAAHWDDVIDLVAVARRRLADTPPTMRPEREE